MHFVFVKFILKVSYLLYVAERFQIFDEAKILVRPYVRISQQKPQIFMKLTKLKTVEWSGVMDDALNIHLKKPEETKKILIGL